MHGVLAFSSTVIGFPGFPFDLPFALLGGPSGASLGFGARIAAATDALAGEALAGTAGVFAFGLSSLLLLRIDCSMDRAFTSSRSSTKTLTAFPKDS